MAEIGRLLRRTRTRQGLRLEEVALRTGLHVSQLEALETGAVAHIPDRVVIVKTLRRYGDALGLPGERLALALIDLWPSPGPGTSLVTVPEAARAGPYGAGSVGYAGGGPDTETLLLESANGGGLYAEFDTAAVPQVFVEEDPTASHPSGPAPISGAFVDTGVNAAVRRRSRPRKDRPRRAPLVLRVLVGVVGLAVLLGSVGLVLYALKPSWFHSLGIGSPNTATSSTAAPPPSHRPTPSSTPTTSVSPVTVTSTGFDTATVTVRGNNPTIRVTASGGPCWVSVSTPTQQNLFASQINDGGQQDFPMGQSISIQLGSGAGHTYVLQGSKIVGSYTPPNAPFTVTFTPAS